jgi:hypothetical protein
MFHNTAYTLGSTYLVLQISDSLRNDLLAVLDLFSLNVKDLTGIPYSSLRLRGIREALAKRQESEYHHYRRSVRPSATVPDLPKTLDGLPLALDGLATSMEMFLEVS